MSKSNRFFYKLTNQAFSPEDALPFLPLKLSRDIKTVEVLGLADSGATINVLPYQVSLELGGNLGNFESRGLIVMAQIADFEPVKLAFAWTKAESVPVILGQTNFFSLFNICFFRQDNEFEIKFRI